MTSGQLQAERFAQESYATSKARMGKGARLMNRRVFCAILWLLAAIALSTGANDILNGLASQKDMGSTISDAGLRDPIVDNVFRFFAAIWLGLGLQFILFSTDLDRYRPALLLLFAIVVLGGFARLLSLQQVGWPTAEQGISLINVGLIAELVVTPLMAVWLVWFMPEKKEDRN